MLPERFSVTFRLSGDALKLLAALGGKLGVGKTAVVELAVRELARVKKLKLS